MASVIGNNTHSNTIGFVGTGVGSKYDLADRLFGKKPSYDPIDIAQSAQQDRRFSEGQIAQQYDGAARQQQYTDYLTSLRGLYGDQVNQQQQTAARNLKFANARTGQTGGSVAADNGALLQKDYQSGLLTAADTARSGVDALRDQDQAEKRSLMALADDASNVGQANTGLLQSQQLGLDAASRQAKVQGLGDMFANLGDVYQKSQAQKQVAANPYAGWG